MRTKLGRVMRPTRSLAHFKTRTPTDTPPSAGPKDSGIEDDPSLPAGGRIQLPWRRRSGRPVGHNSQNLLGDKQDLHSGEKAASLEWSHTPLGNMNIEAIATLGECQARLVDAGIEASYRV